MGYKWTMETKKYSSLTTEYQQDFSCDLPFSEYPRPQLKRDSYLCLNGEWNFSILNKKGQSEYNGKIIVPFVPESDLSGVCRQIKLDETLVYEREFTLPNGFKKERVILHVGACDQFAKVYLNGALIGENVGGYLAFSFDITKNLIDGANTLKIVAKDPNSYELPFGKQRTKRGGMWYTKISGIWQTVWLESLCESHITSIKITTDIRGIDLCVYGGEDKKVVIVEGKEYSFQGEKTRIEIDNPKFWSPENPYLYDLKITSGQDVVYSYFGLRTISIGEHKGNKTLLLNGKPYFFHGLLDQGYFSDGIFLPATEKGFLDDVLKMKECGFNTLRKHIKLEPDLFYYYCDKYGMIVFQDFINSGKYGFFIDTALPTIGLKKGVTHNATAFRKEQFEKTSKGIVDALYNHPCVVYYTIFNEGWGQYNAPENYSIFKHYDPTRIYDTTSGWFKTDVTDVESDHIYFKKIKPTKVKDKPWVVSEFGGYCYKLKDHSYNVKKTFGYKLFKTQEDFTNGLEDLYNDQVVGAIKHGLCATIYTQVSDVEDETNGLLTYDRRVLKVEVQRMKDIAKNLKKAFDEKYN